MQYNVNRINAIKLNIAWGRDFERCIYKSTSFFKGGLLNKNDNEKNMLGKRILDNLTRW